jgi:3-phenylpropionate/trans-cinnamate dioxygenase ferredoxin reductase component
MSAGVLVVGAGLAGARCAEALRAGGYDGTVTLVGDEPTPPYERPALSKELLGGERRVDDLLLRPPTWWAEQGIELRLGCRVDAVEPERRRAWAGGRELAYETLVVATGARARPLGAAETLRTLADAVRLREALAVRPRLAVIGAGFLGAEVASTAVALGADVTLADVEPLPLARVVGPAVGELLAARYREAGVRLRLGGPFDPPANAHVLAAIGADPAGELLVDAGPVATDRCGRTSLPHVYACGDVALFGGERAEHWTRAAAQGAAVARAILGDPQPLRDQPYFWSDQFGLRLQMVGRADGWASVELEGTPDSFRARYLDADGRPLAVLLANRATEVAAARRELAEAA